MCKEVDGEVNPHLPEGLPPPGQKHPLPDDPIVAPKHATKMVIAPNPLVQQESFGDLPLSDI